MTMLQTYILGLTYTILGSAYDKDCDAWVGLGSVACVSTHTYIHTHIGLHRRLHRMSRSRMGRKGAGGAKERDRRRERRREGGRVA